MTVTFIFVISHAILIIMKDAAPGMKRMYKISFEKRRYISGCYGILDQGKIN